MTNSFLQGLHIGTNNKLIPLCPEVWNSMVRCISNTFIRLKEGYRHLFRGRCQSHLKAFTNQDNVDVYKLFIQLEFPVEQPTGLVTVTN